MKSPIALTCGEPAGIGPELAVQAWSELRNACPFFWIGDPRHLPAGTPISEIEAPDQATDASLDGLPVLPHRFASPCTPGNPVPENAAGVIEVIEHAVALVQSGQASAVCTAPIHKKVLLDNGGFSFPGHTEFLGSLAGSKRVVMMLASDQLRVVPATIHIPLADVPTVLTPELLRETIEITAHDLNKQFGISHPRIAIAGLNPHAGEGGAMGREELEWIGPLVTEMAKDGYALSGPKSADTLFHASARKTYDAVIAMYHDQALIPIKTLDFDRGVNVTLGLPFVRTSPDHGTAFDIAGKGIAKPTSLIEALKLAQRLAAG